MSIILFGSWVWELNLVWRVGFFFFVHLSFLYQKVLSWLNSSLAQPDAERALTGPTSLWVLIWWLHRRSIALFLCRTCKNCSLLYILNSQWLFQIFWNVRVWWIGTFELSIQMGVAKIFQRLVGRLVIVLENSIGP